jgi:hypothetical protein
VRVELRSAAEGIVRRNGWRFEQERNRREVVAVTTDGRRVRWTVRGVDVMAPGVAIWHDAAGDPALRVVRESAQGSD